MKKEFLEVGEIVGVHGVRGEVKVIPWCDTPEYLKHFDTFYIGALPRKARSLRIHKSFVLLTLEGIDDRDKAQALVGSVLAVPREAAPLAEGRHFIADLIGLEVLDADTGASIGRLEEIFPSPAHDIYVVRGRREYLIPAVSEFIRQIDPEHGLIRVRILEGMAGDEN